MDQPALALGLFGAAIAANYYYPPYPLCPYFYCARLLCSEEPCQVLNLRHCPSRPAQMSDGLSLAEDSEDTPLLVGADGLSSDEVLDRVKAGQVNEVSERSSRTVREIFQANIFTRFNAILGALVAIILLVGLFRDALFGGVLIANVIIGITQEIRAKRVLDRLAVLSAPRAKIIRSGQRHELPISSIVLDDVLEIEFGDQIVVDGVVLTSDGLEVDESLVSGEAASLFKPAQAPLLSGSFVVAGRGRYRSTAVGARAYAARLAAEARRYQPGRSELLRPESIRFFGSSLGYWSC
jgi:magnesium-transporting ATPase (P-type)